MYRNNYWEYSLARTSHCSYIHVSIVISIPYLSESSLFTRILNFMRTMAICIVLWKTYVFQVQQKIFILDLIIIHKALIPINDGVRHNEPNFTKIPSVKTLIGPIVNIIILLPLGIYLYVRSVNERNGSFLLYPKLQKIFMVMCYFLYWN